uniref:hypothetical protein n=1 Tax=Nocardioides dongkuii TaxID=2760089 RepID=UPI001D0C4830
MPRRRIVPALVLSVSLVAASVTGSVGAAAADDPSGAGAGTPTRAEVLDARAAADAAAGTVAGVQARLAVAGARLQQTQVDAARAAEAFNGARWRAQEARRAVRDASARSDTAARDLESHRAAYAGALTSSYGRAPELSALAAVTHADGPAAVLETSASLQTVQRALDERYDAFRAASTLAQVATDRAEDAQDAADAAAEDARAARDRAAAAADAAA